MFETGYNSFESGNKIIELDRNTLSAIAHGHLEKTELYKVIINTLSTAIPVLADGQEIKLQFRIDCPLNKIVGIEDISDNVRGAKLFTDIWSYQIPRAMQSQGYMVFAGHNPQNGLPFDTTAEYVCQRYLAHDNKNSYAQDRRKDTYSYQRTIFTLTVRKLTQEEKQGIQNRANSGRPQ